MLYYDQETLVCTFVCSVVGFCSQLRKGGLATITMGGSATNPTDLVVFAEMGRVNRYHTHPGTLSCWLVEHPGSLKV